MSWISRIAVDVRPLRESRDFRSLTIGSLVTGLGTQATLVALLYQVRCTSSPARPSRPAWSAPPRSPLAAGSLYEGAVRLEVERTEAEELI